MFLVLSCCCLCPIHWRQVLSREWWCSLSNAGRRCSNFIWVINKFISNWGASSIRGLTVVLWPSFLALEMAMLLRSGTIEVTLHYLQITTITKVDTPSLGFSALCLNKMADILQTFPKHFLEYDRHVSSQDFPWFPYFLGHRKSEIRKIMLCFQILTKIM